MSLVKIIIFIVKFKFFKLNINKYLNNNFDEFTSKSYYLNFIEK